VTGGSQNSRQTCPRRPAKLSNPLCQDHVGTYALPFPSHCVAGVWLNAGTGEVLEADVVGWQLWDDLRLIDKLNVIVIQRAKLTPRGGGSACKINPLKSGRCRLSALIRSGWSGDADRGDGCAHSAGAFRSRARRSARSRGNSMFLGTRFARVCGRERLRSSTSGASNHGRS